MVQNDKRFHMRLSSELYRKLEEEATEKGISISSLIRLICNKRYEKNIKNVDIESNKECGNIAEMKPCPFCGKKANVIKNICEENHFIGYYVFHDCFLIGHSIKTGLMDSEEDAIRTWNKRA